ncbi:hypothetical protein ACFE04_002210 [Oxalis oulophora]
MGDDDVKYNLREIEKLVDHTAKVWCVAWNQTSGIDGAPYVLASCSFDDTIRIWEHIPPSPWHCKLLIKNRNTENVRSCSWSSCGKMLAAARFDATTDILYNFGEGEGKIACVSLKVGTSGVRCVNWTRGKATVFATCHLDNTIRLWEVTKDEEQNPVFECFAKLEENLHTRNVNMIHWNAEMLLLVSCSSDNNIKVWWSEDGADENWECVQTLDQSDNGHSSIVWALSFNADGDKMVTCSDDHTVKIWKSEELMACADGYAPWEHVCTLSHDHPIFSVDWSRVGCLEPDRQRASTIATGAADGTICLFDESTDDDKDDKLSYKMLLKKDKAHDTAIHSVQWCPGGNKFLASGSKDGTIKIWQLETLP